MSRPDFIKNYLEIQQPDDSHYPGSDELQSIGSPFAKVFGLTRLGIHHELLPPGRRTSWPHAESAEEEFVYVLEGHPDAWVDGVLHPLVPGDAIGFRSGTGIAHTLINNSEQAVRLLVVGEASKRTNKINYPLHREQNERMGDAFWRSAPAQDLGPHDGLPDELRARLETPGQKPIS